MQLSIRLDEELLKRLEKMSKLTGRSKTFYVREAIINQIEDLEDTYMAEKALKRIQSGKAKVYSWEEVKKRNGL